MKKKILSVALSFCLVIASMVLLAGCGAKDFDATKMSVGTKSFTYDGSSHIFEVTYEDLDINVSYAEKKDGEFKSADEFNYVNAGTYNLYYKVSAEGYNDYISEEATALTIAKRALTIAVGDTTQLVGATNVKPTLSITSGTAVTGEDVLDDIVLSYNTTGKIAGQTGTITASVVANPTRAQNYDITFTNNPADINLIDAVEVVGATSSYYSNLEDAIVANPNGASIKLWKNVVTSAQINITGDFTIDGQGQFAIVANGFTAPAVGDNNVFFVNNADAELTLKDVIVNANGQGRVVRVNAGKLVVDGATITGGKTVSYAGGVYITGDSVFEMTSGRIYGNQVAEEYASDNYAQYSADLWIGSQANGEVVSTITGGTIGNVFVNANECSQADSDFTLNGGAIENIYVEYDDGNGAKFKFEDGVVENLYISTLKTKESAKVTAVGGTTYVGGIVAVATVNNVDTIFHMEDFTSGDIFTFLAQPANANAYVCAFVDDEGFLTTIAFPQVDEVVLLTDVEVTSQITISNSLVINGLSKYSITAKDFTPLAVGDNNVLFVNNAEVVLTLKDVIVNANGQGRVVRVNAGKLVVDGATITGGKTVSYAGGVYITGDSVFEMTSGRIYGNQVAEEYASDNYAQYSADLWIGSQANGEVVSTITGGTIGNVFVNANECSQADSDFTLNGGAIENIYVEYDDENGAKFKFENGVVEHLYVSTTTSGEAQVVAAVAGKIYVGGANYSA